jgi:hypothetical protein
MMKEHRHLMRANPWKDTDRPAQAASRDRALNARTDVRRADELRWFWAACGELSEPFGDLLKVAAAHGLPAR